MPHHTKALIQWALEMVSLCQNNTRALHTFILHLANFYFLNSFMSLLLLRIYYLFINFARIIQYNLHFTLIIFLWRIYKLGRFFFRAVRDGLYILPADATTTSSPQALIDESNSSFQWHLRLGHPYPWTTAFIIRTFKLPSTLSKSVPHYSACSQAKTHALPYPLSPSQSQKHFQLLFLDVWGPTPVLSSNSCRFYLSIIDDYSKYIWLFPNQSKSNVSSIFVAFLDMWIIIFLQMLWLFNLMVSLDNLKKFFNLVALFIALHALTHMPKMGLLSGITWYSWNRSFSLSTSIHAYSILV